ncbi:MAG: hypothetical protein GF387_02005 [Candidatus Portnoybacteria bacterium]|nr:hypothetical protein [Candidatus Portnoybacteria bacterium]
MVKYFCMNSHIIDFFKSAVKGDKLGHGYLFFGGNVDEMKKVAFWLAEFLEVSSVDTMHIVPEGKDIKIEKIREARRHLSLSPYNSLYKLAIIEGAEAMNINSSNALLKTLEEPKGNTVLILIASRPSFLPDTILSRLEHIRFRGVCLSEVADSFIDPRHVDIIRGSFSDASEFIGKISKNNEEIVSFLDSCLFWFRSLLFSDDKDYSISRIGEIIKEVEKTRDLVLGTNVNKKLALENLVLNFK